jgi:hypothetical protein
MKRLGTVALMAVLVLGLSVFLAACSSGGGGGSSDAGGGGGGGGTAITNNTQGTQAASSSTQGSSMAEGSSQTFSNLGSVGLSAMTGAPTFKTSKVFKPGPAMGRAIKMTEKLAKSRAANAAARAIKRSKANIMNAPTATGSDPCTNGGTASWNLTASDTGTNTFTFDITFASCRENDSQLDGIYRVVASANSAGTGFNMSITLGPTADFTILDYSSGYAALMAKSTMTNFSLGINMVTSGTSTADLSVTSTMTAAGAMTVHDFFSLEDYSLSFTNYSIVFAMSTGTFSITSNGNFSETWTNAAGTNSVEASFSALKIETTSTAAYEDIALSGSFTINFTPDACHEGTYTFVTSPKIRFDNNLGRTVAGVVTINGATTITFNADGTITVATAGTSQTYDSDYELEQVCPIATLDESEPVSSGSTGTTSAANASMTITMNWTDPVSGTSNADMDLHLNYYATQTPTATTVGTWNVDWNHGSICTNPTGVDLGTDNVDVNGDGICDVGLDYDNTSGYGPEHITATEIPAGYYVISVNSFGLADPQEKVDVSIQIGNSMFGPFSHTFTSAGGEDQLPEHWFAVADMVVDSAGNVTVKAHDLNLELWHDGAFGAFYATPFRTKGL